MKRLLNVAFCIICGALLWVAVVPYKDKKPVYSKLHSGDSLRLEVVRIGWDYRVIVNNITQGYSDTTSFEKELNEKVALDQITRRVMGYDSVQIYYNLNNKLDVNFCFPNEWVQDKFKMPKVMEYITVGNSVCYGGIDSIGGIVKIIKPSKVMIQDVDGNSIIYQPVTRHKYLKDGALPAYPVTQQFNYILADSVLGMQSYSMPMYQNQMIKDTIKK